MENQIKKVKEASIAMLGLTEEDKNKALKAVCEKLEKNFDSIIESNKKDLQAAKTMLDKNEISQATFSRLKLDENKFREMISGLKDVIALPDPVNKILKATELDDGLNLYKVSCPIGVILVIFEARPDVIAQIAALCIKSANAVILKGGKEAKFTNSKIFSLISEALEEIKFVKNAINLIFSHQEVESLFKMDEYIDLIIPRGSNDLVKYIKNNTKIPVLGHSSGICHIFVDKSAKLSQASKICTDSKTQYPSACNSVETILVHKNFEHLQDLKDCLTKNNVKIIENPENWSFEYGDLTVSMKIVENLEEAINHINRFGSHHTDCIISEDEKNCEIFMNKVDSASVYKNASTRFADGFRYGFGAEVGISTNKTHARGPVGLDGLTIYKYKLYGNGQTVKPYCIGEKIFTHKNIKL